MRIPVDRRFILVAGAAMLLALQISRPNAWTAAWPPMILLGIAGWLYFDKLRSFDWSLLRQRSYWLAVFYALTSGMIAQAAGIVIVQYGLKIEPPAVPFDITIGIAVSVVVCSAILEELVYRNILFGWFKSKLGFWGGAAASSLLFAAAHANYAAALGYFLLGLVWCRAYKKSGTLAVPIAAHMLFNAISLIVLSLRG